MKLKKLMVIAGITAVGISMAFAELAHEHGTPGGASESGCPMTGGSEFKGPGGPHGAGGACPMSGGGSEFKRFHHGSGGGCPFEKAGDKGAFKRGSQRGAGIFAGYLEENDPKKLEELKKLRTEDPEKFREEIKEVREEIKEKIQAERKEFKELVDKYRESQSEDDKAAIREKLAEQFNKRMEREKGRVEKIEEHLKKLKERVEKRSGKMDEIINSKLDDIIKDPDLRW